ncbi:hypothetical protein PG994_010430 [Apiospora phragmitis]|uniref:Ricin B lectin domain-containing protein n=1 Tax=Apiospora phragmitis TaxID=2905665 RepID=A0ABR1TPV7_9PEZI
MRRSVWATGAVNKRDSPIWEIRSGSSNQTGGCSDNAPAAWTQAGATESTWQLTRNGGESLRESVSVGGVMLF